MTIRNLESLVIRIILPINLKIISNFLSYQKSYGKGQNKADSFPKTGRKQQLVEQMVIIFNLADFLVFTTSNTRVG